MTDPLPTAFGEVAGLPWDDRSTFIVGGGPSLIGFDFERLRGAGHIIGVNASMFRAPCDVGVSMDYNFIRNNYARLQDFIEQGRSLYLVMGFHWAEALDAVPGATYLYADPCEGLSLYTNTVRHGATSGYCALNVAVLKHAKRIVLLGFDYGMQAGRHHYHDEYFWHQPGEQNWPAWARRFDAAAKACTALGVDVVNASPDSSITAFRTMEIDKAIEWGIRQ